MKASEIRELSDEELKKKEADTKEELFNLRVQLATQQTTSVARIGKLKKGPGANPHDYERKGAWNKEIEGCMMHDTGCRIKD
jgi:ribosomal protein L29